MCVPPLDEEPALHFALLREIARRTGLGVLSMGMSADFEKAIRFGAPMCASAPAILAARGGGPPARRQQKVVTPGRVPVLGEIWCRPGRHLPYRYQNRSVS